MAVLGQPTTIAVVLALLPCLVCGQTDKKPEIYSLHVTSEIRYRFARTLVTSYMANRADEAKEAVFEVTLPDDAFISNFTMVMDGKLYPALVKEKKAASQDYEKAKKKGQSAGLVSKKPRETNTFRVEVNVAARAKVTFNLTYEEVLARKLGLYRHAIFINPDQPINDLSITLHLTESRPITELLVPPVAQDALTNNAFYRTQTNPDVRVERPSSKSAVVTYRPSISSQKKGIFAVMYDVSREMDAGDILVDNGYFVHFFAPAVTEPVPRDVLFILDTSSSMAGTKIQQLKDALGTILNQLQEGDKFSMMTFDSTIEFWRKELLPVTSANIRTALQYVARLSSRGYTNIHESLQKGLEFLETHGRGGNSSLIVFLTDGEPTKGIQDPEIILSRAKQKNGGKMPIFSLAFGRGADWNFVQRLAAENKGVAKKIYEDSDADLQISGFYEEIASTLMTGVEFRYLGDSVDADSLTQSSFHSYFNGSELVVTGRLQDLSVSNIITQVIGQSLEGDVQLTVPSKPLTPPPVTSSAMTSDLGSIAERTWAYMTIKSALEKAEVEQNAEKKNELKQKALDLSLQYNFVTPVTSLVVTKPDVNEVGDLSNNEDEASGSRAQSSRRRYGGGGGGGGGGGYGGGGGDPHFMVAVPGLDLPLCFDVDGKEGQVFQLLKDPVSGLRVNVRLATGRKLREHGEGHRMYMTEVAIFAGDVKLVARVADFSLEGRTLQWGIPGNLSLPGSRLILQAEPPMLNLTLDCGASVLVVRHTHDRQDPQGGDYLNVEAKHEERLSDETTGIIGQWRNVRVKLLKTFNKGVKKPRLKAKLRSRDTRDGHVQRAAVWMTARREPLDGVTSLCWMLRKPAESLFPHLPQAFVLPSLDG